MLDFTHDAWLVAASLAVAIMAGFTGLGLTRGANALPIQRRKFVVVAAAIILGGGIWSMHFVAMLGLQLPILFYYDTLITLSSALVAILMVGLALLLLHFRPRTPQMVVTAGLIVGMGIVAMHYIGMAGMQLCKPVNSVLDIALSTIASLVLSVLAIWVAYDTRTHRNIVLGTVCFGLAVFSMHFVAISLTSFSAVEGTAAAGPAMDNSILALGVTVSVFMICGAFLLTGITFIEPAAPEANQELPIANDVTPRPNAAGVPYEREGQTHFALPENIAALRAEGHYAILYMGDDKLFCPWSITEAEKRLLPDGFIRVHRSYLINPSHVSGFERNKDNGTCYFDEVAALTKVPVSRSRLNAVRDALGV